MCEKGILRMGKKFYQRLRRSVAKKLGIVDGITNLDEIKLEEIEEACKIAYFNQRSNEGVQGNEQQWSNKAILASKAGWKCEMKIVEDKNGSKLKISTPPNFDPVFKLLQFKR